MQAGGRRFSTYLVSKQVESVDGLQSCFSQADGAAEIRQTEIRNDEETHRLLVFQTTTV